MNPEAVTAGERPHLEEIGPYVYRNMLLHSCMLRISLYVVFNQAPSIASQGFFYNPQIFNNVLVIFRIIVMGKSKIRKS